MVGSSYERIKKWRANNPERVKEIRKRFRKKHAKRLAEALVDWREKNRDHVIAYSREYEACRSVERAAKRRANYDSAVSSENSRQWRRDNPEKKRAQKHARRARQRGASGRHTALELQVLLVAQNYRCANPLCYANLRRVPRQPDHIVPLVLGGSNYVENMQWLCEPCNVGKCALEPTAWLLREARRFEEQHSVNRQ